MPFGLQLLDVLRRFNFLLSCIWLDKNKEKTNTLKQWMDSNTSWYNWISLNGDLLLSSLGHWSYEWRLLKIRINLNRPSTVFERLLWKLFFKTLRAMNHPRPVAELKMEMTKFSANLKGRYSGQLRKKNLGNIQYF